MKYIFIFLFLAGCDVQPMSNEEIIKQEKLCADAGLVAHEFTTEYYHGQVIAIQCGRKHD